MSHAFTLSSPHPNHPLMRRPELFWGGSSDTRGNRTGLSHLSPAFKSMACVIQCRSEIPQHVCRVRLVHKAKDTFYTDCPQTFAG